MFRSLWQSVLRTVSAVRHSPRLPRREVLVVLGLGLAAFIVTLSVLASRTSADVRGRAAQALKEQEAANPGPSLTTQELALAPDDFMLPDEPGRGTPAYVPWRPRTPVWTREMIDRWWIPPRAIATDILGTANDQAMQRLFEKVP